jgi:hypothetical protein
MSVDLPTPAQATIVTTSVDLWDERSGNRSKASQIKFGLQGGIAVILEDQSQYQKKS